MNFVDYIWIERGRRERESGKKCVSFLGDFPPMEGMSFPFPFPLLLFFFITVFFYTLVAKIYYITFTP